MNSIKKLILSAGLLAGSLGAVAQTTYSGYFLDNYDYRFQMNPAFANEKNYVSFPALGNLNINMNGNLNLSDVIYSRDGKTVLFTNPGISESEAMSKFHDKNRLGTNTKVDLLSFGFKAWGGYNNFSLGLVTGAHVSVPYSFFSLAKEGVTNDTYDIKNMYGKATSYAQLTLNHSRWIKQVPGLRVGLSAKFLLGIGNAEFRFNDAQLVLDQNQWIARTNADIYASIGGFSFKHDFNKNTGQKYVSGGELDSFSPNGFGVAFDLGAQYSWNDFNFSVAALDLGFINWGKSKWASTNGTKEITTDAYTFNANGDAPNSFDNEWDRFTDDLSELYQLEEMPELNSRSRFIGATLNFGVNYELPVYRRLHFGLLNSTRIEGPYTWTQFRLSANIRPINFISLDVNGVMGTYGPGFGWLLNIHTKGFNLFVGQDYLVGKLSKQFIPLNSNNAFNLGINFPF